MLGEVTLRVNNKFAKKYRNGYPLLHQNALESPLGLEDEGKIFSILDGNDNFIGRGYLGSQNKGSGWILTWNVSEAIDQRFFDKKIQTALTTRSSYFHDEATSAFRVFNGEGDGIGGITIDYYDGYYVVSWYSEGIYYFRDKIYQALKKSTVYKAIYQKKRFDKNGKYVQGDDFVTGTRGDSPIIVKENGVNFAVYLNEGPMTGVFLDQKNVRERIMNTYSAGKTVLNTFSYTGAFSVCAALGGAEKTTSVDLANRSLAKTIEQFRVNEIDPETHDIKVMDVFRYFKYAVKNKLSFDVVILDPPSFARSKKNTFSAAKDYKDLLKQAMDVTNENGVIVASTNYSGFGMDKFKEQIYSACEENGGKFSTIEEFSLPSDFQTSVCFPEGDYLKVVFIKKHS
ncbi:class I SAM-dependent rRNA methyltransferase [Alteribacillus sp. HJP-4]|uniref:class I SAM-dependent rRNA methyltransferase n=1 Tax=Alteribacillus sp. HJP-4 TaxID=2775394 RepID=UPI0035CCD6B8